MHRPHPAGGFGRKIDPQAQELERRRDAFLAAERARKVEQPRPLPPAHGPARAASFHKQKSLAVAYLFWFGCGTVSAHRFYLGHTSSAIAQASLWIVGWMMVVSGLLVAALAPLAAFLWLIADAFLMPGLCRSANERARHSGIAEAFA